MSHIPDSIRKQGGFRTTREARDTNCRHNCTLCNKKNILFCNYGNHVLKEHLDLLFDASTSGKSNRKGLYERVNLSSPIDFYIKDDLFHFCLGCKTIFKNPIKAENHFEKNKNCKECHKENIFKLQEAYPKDGAPPQATLKNKNSLEDFISRTMERVRYLEHKLKHKYKDTEEERYEYEERFAKFFDSWDMDLYEETLKEYWDKLEEDSPEPEAEEEEKQPKKEPTPEALEFQADIEKIVAKTEKVEAELYIPKDTVSRSSHLEALLNDPSIDEASKNAIRKELYPTTTPPPPPEKKIDPTPLPPPEQFKTLTPWQRFLSQHQGLSVQEQLVIASTMGIKPDEGHQLRIVSDSKIKRGAMPKGKTTTQN